MARAQVYVTYKEGVLEPQGLAVQGILASLGFEEVKQVRIGKYIEVEIEGPPDGRLSERLRTMCEKVLANPVIEDFRFELSEGDGARPPSRRK
ncbi:MAG: phosphoribosylformylglycinamidine synthase subunit PurS [Candidatus Tectomicrobia bacterium]|nr:phosphoribosylformylglycinamidine synthase subunit PurS [Candidatus Tectomicrobia bacterium]